jgi:hypothetical protein
MNRLASTFLALVLSSVTVLGLARASEPKPAPTKAATAKEVTLRGSVADKDGKKILTASTIVFDPQK